MSSERGHEVRGRGEAGRGGRRRRRRRERGENEGATGPWQSRDFQSVLSGKK